MAGIGPAPKPVDKLAGHGAAKAREAGMRVVESVPTKQPKLSADFDWPAETRDWWKMWADSPLSNDFTSTDWSELAITARLHAAVVTGELKYAAELRLRVAKFGATPEDRARLRITFVAADEAEAGQKPDKPDRKRTERYSGLRAVGQPSA